MWRSRAFPIVVAYGLFMLAWTIANLHDCGHFWPCK